MNELNDKEANATIPFLNKPDSLVMNGYSRGGLIYSANTGSVTVKPICFTCHDKDKTRLKFNISPLWKKVDGSVTNAHLLIDGLTVIESSSLDHQFSLQGSLKPGLYHSQLTIIDDENTTSIPVRVCVSAHWIWLVFFLFLGLISFGIGQYFADEQSLYEKRQEILELRKTFSEFKDQNQTAIVEQVLTSDIDELFSTALKKLNSSRPIGLKDTRIETADYYQKEILTAITKVHKKLDGKFSGEIEFSSLKNRWDNLINRTNEIEKLLTNKNVDIKESSQLIAAVTAQLEKKMIGQFITPSITVIRNSLSIQVAKAKLIYSTGQIDRAKQFSRTVEIWLQRAASQLEKSLNLILSLNETFKSIILLEFKVGNVLQNPAFNNHKVIKEKFNRANQIIKQRPNHTGIRDAHEVLQAITIDIVRIRSDKLIAEYQQAIKQIQIVTSLDVIDQIFETVPKVISPKIQRQILLKVLAAWNSISDRFIILETKKAAKVKIEEIRQLLMVGDFTSTIKPLGELKGYWEKDYDQRLINEQIRLFRPYCKNMRIDAEQAIISTEIKVKQLQPHSGVTGFDKQLDRLKLKLKQTPEGMECLDYFVNVDEKIFNLSNKVFNIRLMLTGISAEDKLEAAKYSGLEKSIRLMELLIQEPWPIAVNSRTSDEEHYVDRNLVVAIDNLKQSWGIGTLISIDFGDGTPLVYKSAEKVKAAGVVSHRYSSSGYFTIHITALTDKNGNEILGEGRLSVNIEPSPVSKARQLAATFLNMRVLLSLVIALLIHVWRQNRDMPFGSYGRDYVEAFAIGVGSNASIEGFTVFVKTITG